MNLKHLCFFLSAALISLAAAIPVPRFKPYADSPRIINIGKQPRLTLCKDGKVSFEVVKPADKAAENAAEELLLRLTQITGKKIKTVAKASGKVPAFYLGVCKEAKQIGLNPEKLDRDGYFIKTDKNRIFITGLDGGKKYAYQCGTLYGVYDFLERFAGVRYYFPGDIGIIVPQKKDWQLPDIDITERPDTQYRVVYSSPCGTLDCSKYYYPGLSRKNRVPAFWRLSTLKTIGSSHGLNDLELAKRFAKTNPEFFALTTDGKRHDGTYNTTGFQIKGHLCFSSEGLLDVIFKDSVAALTGQPASSRGISKWSQRWTTQSVNPAPNDGLYWCQCPPCKKIQQQGKQAMSDHIWDFRIRLANRLKEAKVPGIVVCNSYGAFSAMPSDKIKMPDNVVMGVALRGPWAVRNKEANAKANLRIQSWAKRMNKKINSWTYTTKACAKIAAVPNFTPRAVGEFYKAQKNYIYGSFLESGTDRWIFGFMNAYVFAKVMWNFDTDVEALIEEHCRLMYGKAAPLMNRFYREIEDLWLDNIVKDLIATNTGESWLMPPRHEIWSKIYTPAKIAELNSLFDKAEKAAANDKDSLKRIRFIRREMWQPVLDEAAAFGNIKVNRSAWTLHSSDAKKITFDGKLNEKEWHSAHAIWLQPNRSWQTVQVNTKVKMLQDKDFFYFGIEAEEPETQLISVTPTMKYDDPELWRDNGIEIFLSRDYSSDFLYQFIFNSAGATADLKHTGHSATFNYNSRFEVKTAVYPGKSWTAEVKIPRSALPELADREYIIGNFTRNRKLQNKKVTPSYYAWFLKIANKPEYSGIIQLKKAPVSNNLIQTGDFDQPVKKNRIGKWSGVKQITLDKTVFLTCGSSVRLEGKNYAVRQTLPLQPNRRYKLSFYLRTQDLTPGFKGIIRFGGQPAVPCHVFNDYRTSVSGTNYWIRVEKVFTSPAKFGKNKPYIALFIPANSTGKCWIDHVELIEIK